MGRHNDYEYIVIGSGAAGSAAALLAAGLGVKTAIIEADSWGGTTLNYRDIPYGAALGFAQRYAEAVAGSRFGMSSTTLRYNYPTVLNWQAAAVKRAGGGNRSVFENAGIDCYLGYSQFVNPHEIVLDDTILRGEKFLIASGTNVSTRGIEGAEDVHCWSPSTALRMAQLPKALIVIGGGSTGCELAEYFAALGVQVLLAETEDRILPKEDPEVSEVIEKHLRDRFGVKVLTNSQVTALTQDGPNIQAFFVRDGEEKTVRINEVVLATTPEPIISFGLKDIGVKFNRAGILVNKNLQTTRSHIFAAGDVIGGECSYEKATYDGKLATLNAIKKSGNIINYTGFMRMTDTMPRVAKVGMNEQDCLAFGQKYRKSLVPLDEIVASNINDFRAGFVKLLVEPKGQIIGATVVAPEADLIAQEVALAIRAGLQAAELAGTPHVATNWAEALRIAARELA